jgi:hypothetical protein
MEAYYSIKHTFENKKYCLEETYLTTVYGICFVLKHSGLSNLKTEDLIYLKSKINFIKLVKTGPSYRNFIPKIKTPVYFIIL